MGGCTCSTLLRPAACGCQSTSSFALLPRTNTSSPLESSSREWAATGLWADRKSTRLNYSHLVISYAAFCLKKKHFAAHGLADPPAHATSGLHDLLIAQGVIVKCCPHRFCYG